MMKIGVLALQGAVSEHIEMLQKAGAQAVAVKQVSQLAELDGLVIPGGESTTIGKMMDKYGFKAAIKDFSAQKKPIFGTCAGMIVLANRINGTEDCHLGLMDVKVERNAFGRQKESFEAALPMKGVADDFPAVFIRAPYVMEVGSGVEILSTVEDKIVAARQDHLLVSAFHPELTDDERMHAYFLQMVKESQKSEPAQSR